MSRTFKRTNWKGIIGGVLVAVILIAVVSVFAISASADAVEIKSSAFKVGGLDEEGKYKASKTSIYTEEAFECIGLRVVPDFESQVTYDVYYYDYDERLVGMQTGLSEVYDEDFPLACMARIVIYPEVPDDVKKSNFEVKWYEVNGYANDLTITVDKTQNYLYEKCVNLYVDDNAEYGKTFDNHANDVVLTIVDNEAMKVSEKINVTGEYDYYDIYIRKPTDTGDIYAVSFVCASDDETVLVRESFNFADYEAGEWVKLTLEVPTDVEEDMFLIARMPTDAECYIFGYND